MKHLPVSLFLLVCVGFVPGAQARYIKAKYSSTHGRGNRKSRKFVFLETARVGDKFTWAGRFKVTMGKAGSSALETEIYSEELIKKAGNIFIWKVTTDQAAKATSDMKVDPAKVHKHRVEIYARNQFGNLISQQGTLPWEPVVYGEWPEVPVRVGDSWKGHSVVRGKRYTDVYTLKSMTTISGKECALVSVHDGGSPPMSQMKWFDFSIHQSPKIVFRQEESDGVTFTGIYQIIGKDGRPLLP